MDSTCHGCHGFSFRYQESNLRRCSGCSKVYYCSTECQKKDWFKHIFDCNPGRPINTADHLALACYKGEVLTHPQTREDYGFDRADGNDGQRQLLALYAGLIKHLRIPPTRIHKWRVRGVLVDQIKVEYYKLSLDGSWGVFPWFLLNEQVVAMAGHPLSERRPDAHSDAAKLRAWRFIGGSEKDSAEDIDAALERKSEEERKCFWLYVLVMCKSRPAPCLVTWLDFGFAGCSSEVEEMQLCVRYDQLIYMCTFKEFCDALRTRSLLDLFRSKRLPMGNKYLLDILGSVWTKSVWHLKQYIREEGTATPELAPHPAVMVDYGFFNCSNAAEEQELKKVYKAFFDNPAGDPLALHEAVIRGDTYGCVSTVVRGLDARFQQLMKNPYPLPQYD